MANQRLDILLLERGLCSSRTQAQALVLSGAVWSGQQRLDKAGVKVNSEIDLEIRSKGPRFSSRGGEKLSAALEAFSIEVSGRTCIDLGASTGGFTDCLLQNGAAKVFSVDVGYGQLDQKLRNDPRVRVLERTNARHLQKETLLEKDADADQISLGVADLSFISLLTVLRPVSQQLPSLKDWVLLFKPQFEVGPKHIGKGGLVRSAEAVEEALHNFNVGMNELGWTRNGLPKTSPLPGKKSGNVEYLVHYEANPQNS